MSYLHRLFKPRASAIDSHKLFVELFGGSEAASGIIVTPERAMQASAVYSCVRVLAEGVAQLPLKIYRRRADNPKAKDEARDHWLWRLLHDEPNEWQTSFEFREMLTGHAVLSGNGYALETVVRDEVRELLPIVPGRVKPKQDERWRVMYDVYMPDGTTLEVPPDRMFHLPGLAFNGLVGMSPVQVQRDAIGLALQMQRHGSRIFKNGAAFSGVLEHPTNLSDDAQRRLREQFDEKYSGTDNAWKTLLLEEGTKWTATGMGSKDAQFLESMKHSRSEIAGFFRVPAHMINDLEKATFSNIEHQALGYVMYSLAPWLGRWEQRIVKSLIPAAERETLVASFLVQGLLRGDVKTRQAFYKEAILTGWMTRNEVRLLEDMNPGPAELDEFIQPQNTANVGDEETDEDVDNDEGTVPPPGEGEEPDEEEEEEGRPKVPVRRLAIARRGNLA